MQQDFSYSFKNQSFELKDFDILLIFTQNIDDHGYTLELPGF